MAPHNMTLAWPACKGREGAARKGSRSNKSAPTIYPRVSGGADP